MSTIFSDHTGPHMQIRRARDPGLDTPPEGDSTSMNLSPMQGWLWAHLREKESPVILPERRSRKASFRQHRVGEPTSYLMPTTFTDSWS